MNRKTLVSVIIAAFLAGAVAWAAPRIGSVITVRSLNTQVMSEPTFLSTPLAKVYRGTHVTYLGKKGAWYKVRLNNGTVGWVHKSRVIDKMLNLSRRPGASEGASKDEVELARRGFNPSMERELSREKNLNYSYVDRMEKMQLDPETVKNFMIEGKLRFRAVVRK